MSTRPGLIVVLRDTASFLAGWALIFKQAGIIFAPPPQVSEFLVIVGAAVIGVPGIAQLVALRSGLTVAPTAPSSDSSPSPASSPSSSGSPQSSGEVAP